jgi:hypothetical protein
MHRLTVDYTRYLRSPVVEVALFASERAGLNVGDTVLVNGEDGIPETVARSSFASSTLSGRLPEPWRLIGRSRGGRTRHL